MGDDDATPPSEPSEEEYEIEAIVGKRKRKGKSHYRVKWAGYGSEDNTWEPLQNLQNCLDKIEKFEAEASAKRKERYERSK